jgi:hypothetical protein
VAGEPWPRSPEMALLRMGENHTDAILALDRAISNLTDLITRLNARIAAAERTIALLVNAQESSGKEVDVQCAESPGSPQP